MFSTNCYTTKPRAFSGYKATSGPYSGSPGEKVNASHSSLTNPRHPRALHSLPRTAPFPSSSRQAPPSFHSPNTSTHAISLHTPTAHGFTAPRTSPTFRAYGSAIAAWNDPPDDWEERYEEAAFRERAQDEEEMQAFKARTMQSTRTLRATGNTAKAASLVSTQPGNGLPADLVARVDMYRPKVSEEDAVALMEKHIPADILDRLYGYQRLGVKFALRCGGRTLLADEMGLGKTVQAICIAACYPENWPLLIVCPSSLRYVWREKLQDWLPPSMLPDDDGMYVIETGKQLEKMHAARNGIAEEPKKKPARKSAKSAAVANDEVVVADVAEAPKKRGRKKAVVVEDPVPEQLPAKKGNGQHICIISYDLVQKMGPEVHDYGMVICDEAHNVKSPSAKRTQYLTNVVKKAKRAVLITGTPVLSRPIELWTQVDMLCPGLLGKYEVYGDRYCTTDQERTMVANMKKRGRSIPFPYKGSVHLDELNYILTNTMFIRRLKDEVLQELPDKIRRRVTVDIDPEFKPDLKRILDDMKKAEKLISMDKEKYQNSHLLEQVLTEFYRATGPAKVAASATFVTQLLEQDLKVLVFAHHQVVLDHFEATMRKEEIGYMRIDGSVNDQKRMAAVNTFQDDPNCRVALLSITAAGVGITLTAARVVVFAEMYWNPSNLIQAEDRAHRLGQKNAVDVFYLHAVGTCDDILWPMVNRKLNVVSRMLDGTALNISKWSPSVEHIKEFDTGVA